MWCQTVACRIACKTGPWLGGFCCRTASWSGAMGMWITLQPFFLSPVLNLMAAVMDSQGRRSEFREAEGSLQCSGSAGSFGGLSREELRQSRQTSDYSLNKVLDLQSWTKTLCSVLHLGLVNVDGEFLQRAEFSRGWVLNLNTYSTVQYTVYIQRHKDDALWYRGLWPRYSTTHEYNQ